MKEAEKMKKEKQFKVYQQYCKEKKCRCDRYCPLWNGWDKDCEMYGVNHLSMKDCMYQYGYWLEDVMNDRLVDSERWKKELELV